MASAALIEFKGVSKSFGKVQALTDISFKIDKGEFVFLIGPSGSGKTTILRLLLGEYQATAGEVLFDGVDVAALKGEELATLRRRIGVVFQDFRLLAERTVGENLEVALAINQVEETTWPKRIEELLRLVGLADKAEMFPAQLSGGEIQRVGLARALAGNPELIFADEPTGNLDWKTAEGIVELLVKINKSGKTVMVTSHNKSIVDKMKKRVIEIKDGKHSH